MLTKLLPDQISDHWDIIKYAIAESLPPTAGEGPDKMNRILSSLLTGKAECWISSTITEENVRRFEAVSICKIQYDDISNTKNMLIYSLYGYEKIDRDSWTQAFITLGKYAKSRGCSRIVAYVNLPYLIELAKEFNANVDYTLVSFPIL
jgi:hypothetical protein